MDKTRSDKTDRIPEREIPGSTVAKKPCSPLPDPSAAVLSGPARTLLGAAFLLTAGSGIGLWLWPVHGCRVVHGGTIPCFLLLIGFIGAAHVIPGWRLQKNRLSGGILLAAFAGLALTGWMLYYAGAEAVQKSAGIWHAHLGSGMILLLIAHAILGLRNRVSPAMEPETPVKTSKTPAVFRFRFHGSLAD